MRKVKERFEPLTYVDIDSSLYQVIKIMTLKRSLAIGVKKNDRNLMKVLTIRDVLKYLIRPRESLNKLLSKDVSFFIKRPRYYTTHSAELITLINLIRDMKYYRLIFVIHEKRKFPIGFLRINELIKLFNYLRSSWYNILSEERYVIKEPIISSNTTMKGCIRRLLESNSTIAIVHRKGKVLGVVDVFNILNCLISEDTSKYIARGNDDYFYYTTCSTVMSKDFDFLSESDDIEDMYDFLENYGYLLVLKNSKSKVLSKFISNGSAFSILKRLLKSGIIV